MQKLRRRTFGMLFALTLLLCSGSATAILGLEWGGWVALFVLVPVAAFALSSMVAFLFLNSKTNNRDDLDSSS